MYNNYWQYSRQNFNLYSFMSGDNNRNAERRVGWSGMSVSRILPVLICLAGVPAQATSVHDSHGTYAAVALTTEQPLTATAQRLPIAAAPLMDSMEPTGSVTVLLPELAHSETTATSDSAVRARIQQLTAQSNVEQTLRTLSNAGAEGVAVDVMQSLIDQGAEHLEEELQGHFIRSFNLNWQLGYGGRPDLLQADTLMSLWSQGKHSTFGQVGLQSRDKETGFNVGLGYRTQPVDAVLLGLNVFYDYLSYPKISRYSIGVEAHTSLLDFTGNWYQGLRDETLSDGRIAYTPDGYDIEFTGRLPQLPYLEVTGRYYRWNGQGAGARDLEGMEYGVRLSPVPLFTLESVYENQVDGGDDVGIEVLLEYEFAVPLNEQLSPAHVVHQDNVWLRRFERVRRQYEQRVWHEEQSRTQTLRITEMTNSNDDALTVSWPRLSAARSAALSWAQASTLIQTDVAPAAADAVPLVETGRVTLDMTDPAICPTTGTVCSYMIEELIAGTDYQVTVMTYTQANAGGTLLEDGRVMLRTSGTRPSSVVSVTASPLTVSEGQMSTITLSVLPAPNAAGGISVPFTLMEGAGLSASEYTLTDSDGRTVRSPVVIAAGTTTMTLTLTTLTDTDTAETAETLTFALATPVPGAGYTLGTSSQATITINPVVAAPMPTVEFVAGTLTVAEDAGMAEVMVRLNMAPAATVTIPVMTANATAIAGSDYTAVTQNVTVLSTETGAALTKTVSIPITNDNLDEDDETFTVRFGALTGVATGATTSVTVTITDNDDAPQLTVAAYPDHHRGRPDGEHDHDHLGERLNAVIRSDGAVHDNRHGRHVRRLHIDLGRFGADRRRGDTAHRSVYGGDNADGRQRCGRGRDADIRADDAGIQRRLHGRWDQHRHGDDQSDDDGNTHRELRRRHTDGGRGCRHG